jgi:hypothetical protein
MRTYGAPESNGWEGLVVVALFAGATLIAAGWAYLTDALQVALVIVGAVVMASSVFFMIRSRKV